MEIRVAGLDSTVEVEVGSEPGSHDGIKVQTLRYKNNFDSWVDVDVTHRLAPDDSAGFQYTSAPARDTFGRKQWRHFGRAEQGGWNPDPKASAEVEAGKSATSPLQWPTVRIRVECRFAAPFSRPHGGDGLLSL